MRSSQRLGWVLAACAMFCWACGAPAPAPPTELFPLPELPELADADPAVREQLHERHAFVVQRQADDSTRAQGLAWAFGQLGIAYQAYLQLEAARLCLLNAHTLEPEEFRWPYYLGYLERTEGNFETSDNHFETVLTLQPEHVPTWVWLGENALDQLRLERAEEKFERALALEVSNVKARSGLGRIALERDDFAGAVQHLEVAGTAQPEASELLYALGLAHRGLGDSRRAQEFFDRVPTDDNARVPIDFDDPLLQEISALRRSGQYYARRGMKAIARGQISVAVDELRQALAATPERPDVRYNLAASLLRLGQRQPARAELEELLKRSPNYAQAHVLFARVLIAEGNLAEAESHLRHALASDSKSERAHLVLGDVLRLRGGFEPAFDSYSRALELAPELASANFGRAAVRLLQGDFDAAAIELHQSLATLPGDRELLLLQARMLATSPRPEARDGERALALAQAAVRGRETVADAETLAMAFAELGRFEDAMHWQRAALARVDSAATQQRIRKRLELYERGLPCRVPWQAGERLTAERVQPGVEG